MVDGREPDPGVLETPGKLLESGGVGVIPTDTIYGIVALAADDAAVARVARIKGRPSDKPFPVLVGDISVLERLGVIYDERHRLLMDRFWPGGLTLVLPKSDDVKLPFQYDRSLAVRVPEHPVALWLLRSVGPLVAPSANPSGGSSPVGPGQIDESIRSQVDFVIEAGACPGGRESTVADLRGELKVLREGAISREELERALAD